MLFAKSFYISIFLLLTTALLKANNDNYHAGARSAALSNASVTLSDDVWSTFHNQAGLAFLEKPSAGLYFENRFLVKELSMQAGTIAIPLKPGTLAACYRYFGFSKYYEAKFGIACGIKIASHLSLGLQIDWLQTFLAEGYGTYNALTAEIGLLAEPIKNFWLGLHLYNPIRAKQNDLPEGQLPSINKLGIRYRFDKKASIMLETEKDISQKPIFKGGIEFAMLDNLFFRSGYASGLEPYSFGIGYKVAKINADIACTHHQVLGFTPQLSLGCEF